MAKIATAKRIYKILLYVLAVFIIIIVIGTIIGLARQSDTPLISFGKETRTNPTETSAWNTDDIRIFSGLGRLRIPLANSAVLVLSIAFPYQASDIAFTEELAGKIPEFKNIAMNYFSGLSENEASEINEEDAKAEILARFNQTLRLGQISILYFNDMLVMSAN